MVKISFSKIKLRLSFHMQTLDYRLYLVTDRSLCQGRHVLEVIEQAVAGGVTLVQIREKDIHCRQFLEIARQTKSLLTKKQIPLIINDRVDVALAIGADGIHIGQEDMPVEDVRKLVGPSMAIGLSVNTLDQVREANKLQVDYIGVGPIYPTKTKKDAKKPLLAHGFEAISDQSIHPVVAIGGITADNAADVIRAGANGLAIVSDICSADSPQARAQKIIDIIDRERMLTVDGQQ